MNALIRHTLPNVAGIAILGHFLHGPFFPTHSSTSTPTRTVIETTARLQTTGSTRAFSRMIDPEPATARVDDSVTGIVDSYDGYTMNRHDVAE